MCLSIPGKIIKIKGKVARVSQGNHEHDIDISTLDEKPAIGQYLTFYQGVAVNAISKEQAEENLNLIKK